jgi:Leucine-rich repeat (LRR) protein
MKNDTELIPEPNDVTVVPVTASKSLREIHLRNNEISEIAIETFKQLDELTILDLSKNRLSNLQAGTFDLKNLEVLILSENQLQTLSTNLFEGAGKLQSLSLDSNNIIGISAFNELDNLKFMNLSHNAIKKINFGVFKLPALNTLNLSNNKIHTIEEDAFLVAQNLTDLDLSNNKLMKIGSGMLTGLVQLKIFNLKSNQIGEIVKFPNQLKNLQNLTLSSNNLTDLNEETFSELSGLEKLDLSYNQLESIRVVSGLKSLLDLSLEGNKIRNIESGQFQDLTSLKKLNLGNNQINETGNEDFKGLESLNILILSGNPIKKISESAFLVLKNLTELYLDGKHCFKRNFSLTDGALKNLKICPRNFNDEVITEESEDFLKMSMETLNYLIIIGIILIVLTIGIISAILYRYKKLKETSDSNPAEKGIYYNNEHEKLSNPI